MLLNDPIQSPALSYWIASRIGDLRSSQPKDNIDAALGALRAGPVTSVFRPGDSQAPHIYLAATGGVGLALIDGIATSEQSVSTWNGYVGSDILPGSDVRNSYFATCANVLIGQLLPAWKASTITWLLAGWSLGGAVAQTAMVSGMDLGLFPNARWLTFGSPRIGSAQYAAQVSSRPGTRWMNQGDPIPLVPPRLFDMPALPALYGLRATVRMQLFVHAKYGVELLPDGTARAAQVPSLTVAQFPSAIAAWLLGTDADAGSPHNIATYHARIALWLQAHPNPSNVVNPNMHVEPIATSVHSELTDAERVFHAALLAQAATQVEHTVTIPPFWRFTAVNVERVWCVLFGGQVVVWAGPKKRARAMARAGNEFLSRLLHQGYVDQVQLAQTLNAWIAAASNPGSGILPLIANTLP